MKDKLSFAENGQSETDTAWVSWFGVSLLLFLYTPIFYFVAGYGFWRHDDIPYLHSFDWQLKTEGRWLNYLLFNWITLIPAYIAWCINFISIFWFCYSVALRFFRQHGYALIITAACLAAPGIYAQLNWPVTTLPAALLLAISVPLSRKIAYLFLFPIMGIMLFAVLPNFYYLLPLLYVERNFTNIRAAVVWWTKLLITWAGSFVLGYVIANLIVWWKFGAGIKLAGWRHPHPVTNLASLLDNTQCSFTVLAKHFSNMFPFATVILLGVIFMVAWQVFYNKLQARWLPPMIVIIICSIVGIAHYVVTIPAGISIAHRTVFPLYIVVVYGVFALPLNRVAMMMVIFLGVVTPAWIASLHDVAWYSALTRHMQADVVSNLPAQASKFTGAIIDVRKFSDYYRRIARIVPNHYSVFDEGLSESYRWERALTTAGLAHNLLCSVQNATNKTCSDVFAAIDAGVCSTNTRSICVVGITSNNAIILRLQP